MASLQILLILAIAIAVAVASSAAGESPSFSSILRSHGLPIGLVPNEITSFTVDPSSGRFQVHLQQACNAKFENRVHYDFNVTGLLSYGQIAQLSGILAQELFLWFPVKEIRVDVPSSGLIYFDVGGVVFKQFSLSLFETPPECANVESAETSDRELMTKSDLKDLTQKTAYPRPLRASS